MTTNMTNDRAQIWTTAAQRELIARAPKLERELIALKKDLANADIAWTDHLAILRAQEETIQQLTAALDGLMKQSVKLAEKQDDGAAIWAYIDDASDAIAKAQR